MDKDTQYEEIDITIDGNDYTIDFVVREYWDWVDHGIGPYEYWGAFGIHEDLQWELKEVEVFEIFVHEYNDGQLIAKSDLDDWDKDFRIKVIKECISIGEDKAKEPKESGSYYYNTKDYYDEDDYRNTYLD